MTARLEQAVLRNHRIVVSAITYAEMRWGHWQEGFAPPRSAGRRVQARLDAILPDRAAVDATTDIKSALANAGTPIGPK